METQDHGAKGAVNLFAGLRIPTGMRKMENGFHSEHGGSGKEKIFALGMGREESLGRKVTPVV